MSVVGRVESLGRYPVKSMAGERLEEAFFGFAGVYGDRIYAFRRSTGPVGFPFLTAREQNLMLRYRPRFRSPADAAQPPNLAAAQQLLPGVTPLYGTAASLAVEVVAPSGEVFAIDSPALLRHLVEGIGEAPALTLLRSERALTDCRPVSLFSLQTAEQLGRETGATLDPRRFRANVYLDLDGTGGFGENTFVGRSLRLGDRVVVAVLERDPRCKMITLDPDTGASDPAILRAVAQGHDGMAGVYAAVLVEGTVRPGDPVTLLD